MIFKPNLINASLITQTRPELYVSQLLPRKHRETGVTFQPVLLKVEVKEVIKRTSQSEKGVSFGVSFTGAALRSMKYLLDVRESTERVHFNVNFLGSTLVNIRKELTVSKENVQLQATLLSAQLNANFNRGYSLEPSDSVVYGAVVTGVTLLQRT
mgnify:FL=1